MELPSRIREIYEKSECLYSKQQVEAALDQMATNIHQLLENENPILLCVLIGGIVPVGNLLPRLDFPLELHYVHATRYLGKTQGGDIHWKAAPMVALKDRTVLIVDDILDGGLTLASIMDHCRQQQAKNVYSAVLVDKQHPRETGGLEKADFTGLTVDDRFVFGYGMDYQEYLRNAPGVYVVPKEYE